MKTKLIIAFFTVLIPISVNAEYKLMTADSWYQTCDKYLKKNKEENLCKLLTATAIENYYAAYLHAMGKVYKVKTAEDLKLIKPYCIRPDSHIDDYIKVLHAHISSKPELKNKLLSTTIGQSLYAAFPCK